MSVKSFSVKLGLIVFLISFSLVIYLARLFYQQRLINLEKDNLHTSKIETQIIAKNLLNVIVEKDYKSLNNAILYLRNNKIGDLYIFDATGNLLSGNQIYYQKNYVLIKDLFHEGKFKQITQNEKIINFAPVTLEKQIYGGIILETFFSPLEEIRTISGSVLPIFFISLLLSFLFSIYIVIHLQRPLLQIITSLTNVARGDYSYKIKLKRKDELGILSTSLNQTLTALQQTKVMYLEQINNLQTLNNVANVLSQSLNLDVMLKAVAQYIAQSLKIQQVIIFTFDRSRNAFVPVATSGIKEEHLMRICFPLNEGIVGLTAKKNEVIVLENPLQDGRFKILNVEEEDNIKSLLCIPLSLGDKVVGVLSLTKSQDNFLEEEINFLKIITTQVAQAIENATLYKLAVSDDLTELFIYRYFKNRLAEEIARAKRYKNTLSLIMLDIDYFKKVNDTYGHPAGDKVLQKLAEIIKENIRLSDIACRNGGEEFAIILPNTDLSGTKILAERLRTAVEKEKINYNGNLINVTISVGCSFYEQNLSQEDFIKQTDELLYKAKNNGRNCVVVKE